MSETTEATTGLPTLTELGDLIRARRTAMFVDQEREVPHALVAELCDLAQWAPNHKRTWPWRFALLEGGARARLGDAIAEVMASLGDPEPKVAKTRTKYLRTPALLVLGAAPGDSELRTAENRDAGAAGMQNVLLGATAAGLASYWGSVAKGANDVVAGQCGFEPGTHVVGMVYLGWPVDTVQTPERPPVEVTFLS